MNNCPYCGRSVYPYSSGAPKKYCAADCRWGATLERKRLRHKRVRLAGLPFAGERVAFIDRRLRELGARDVVAEAS